MKTVFSVAGVVLVTCLVGACGLNGDATSSRAIGPEGGTVTSADGRLEIQVPPGAFPKEITVAIQPVDNEVERGIGRAYRVTPEGALGSAVALSFNFEDAELDGASAAGLGIAFRTAETGWSAFTRPKIDLSAGRITVQTDHFSDWALFEMLYLDPASAEVKRGREHPVRVMSCIEDDPDALIAPLVTGCRALNSAEADLGAWAVNGVTGGGGSAGTIQGQGATAAYTAPDAIPTPDTVSVTVEVNLEGDARGLLVSRMKIIEACPAAICRLTGTSRRSTRIGDDLWDTGEAQVIWEFSEMQGTEAVYVPSGTATAKWEVTDCTISLSPSTLTIAPTDGELHIDFAQNPPTYRGEGYSSDDNGTQTWTCPNSEPFDQLGVSTSWFYGSGVVVDGTTLQGSVTEDGHEASWSLVRN